jgi:GTP-binding protein
MRGPVSFLFSASKLPNIPADSNTPEIAFLGRSNVGKSSLLNALLNKKNAKIAHESKHPGRTKTMNLFGVGGAAEGVSSKRVAKKGMSLEMLEKNSSSRKELKRSTEVRNIIGQGGLVVVDCPGYGYGSRDEWGEVVIRYLQKREQLVRAYLLVDITVGLKKSDEDILKILREADTPHQVVLSKVDKILFPGGKLDLDSLPQRLDKLRVLQDEFKGKIASHGSTSMSSDVLCTSSNDRYLGKYKRIGIEELQYAVLDAAGLVGEGKEIDTYEDKQEQGEYHGVVGWDQLGKLSASPSTSKLTTR